MRSVSQSGSPVPTRPVSKLRDAFGFSRPVLLWAVVLAVTLLSFYVHLLNEQVLRAQALHAAPLAGVVQAKAGTTRAARRQALAPAAAHVPAPAVGTQLAAAR